MKKYIIAILFLSIYNVYGQNDTTATLLVVAGGSANFHFNSFTKTQGGIRYDDWTRLKPRFIVTVAGVIDPAAEVPWSLSVRANSLNIQGDGANSLDLGTVWVRATIGGTPGTWVPLSNLDTEIATGNYDYDDVNEDIFISYACGTTLIPVTTPVLGEETDYYFVDLTFTLQSTNL